MLEKIRSVDNKYQMKFPIDSIPHYIDYMNFAAIGAQSYKLNASQLITFDVLVTHS